jgi:hypothetical protein
MFQNPAKPAAPAVQERRWRVACDRLRATWGDQPERLFD